ncbi:MAG: ATP-binding protein [Woeseia sp.]
MNLKRQLLLVSLLTLVLPWAGCQFIQETETALREGQQQMLAGTAQAIADSLSQFPQEFLAFSENAPPGAEQLYAHPLARAPLLDGYFNDWTVDEEAQRTLRGIDGPIRFVLGLQRQQLWLYVRVADNEVVYAQENDDAPSDRITLVSSNPDGSPLRFVFAAEAPGPIVARQIGGKAEQAISGHWQDVPGGYQLEARIPRQLIGPTLGVIVDNVGFGRSTARSSSFSGSRPGLLVTPSIFLQSVLNNYAQPGLRLIVTDAEGWRLASAGDVTERAGPGNVRTSGWLRAAYDAIIDPAADASLAAPDVSGREQQPYIAAALNGKATSGWFRLSQSGRAVVAVAQPVWSGNVQTGVLVLQQGTDAILSLTSAALTRLFSFTLLATLVAAGALLGYASWLSQRVRRLSRGARRALDDNRAHADLPSLSASDEIGDLSRSFASVLKQLGEYNEYLRTLASKLSHELRTPLTIVRSSLDNLEHEPLSDEGRQYTGRARDGVDRLKNILSAMSEASRVEEVIDQAEIENFDLDEVLQSTVSAYRDAWPDRQIAYEKSGAGSEMQGSPELIIQMLDKLVDNAVDFSAPGDTITLRLRADDETLQLDVENPGPPLPEKMRGQLFASMISVRKDGDDAHLGLGLFIARLIAKSHGGSLQAENTDNGVCFTVQLRKA